MGKQSRQEWQVKAATPIEVVTPPVVQHTEEFWEYITEEGRKKLFDDEEYGVNINYSQAPNGRICVGWKQRDVTVIILESTTQLVHCQVEDRSSQFKCKISFVYGFNTIAARKTLWDTLRLTGRNMDDPWVVLGDLNTVLYADDRINGIPVHLTKTVDFQSCVTDVGLGQITRRGWQYSWSNKRDSPERIYSHIDWAFENDKWFQHYGSLEATYHNLGCSDHTPITIITGVSRHKLKKLFRLLNVLLSKDAFKEVVKECWLQRITGYSITNNGTTGIYIFFQALTWGDRSVTREEVLQALKELPNDKAPGIDGYPAEFFKEYWGIVGEDIINAILQFFENGKLLKEVNCTTITLVPKVANPTYVKDYKHIAYCSTIYKLIANVLTGRLKRVVDYLVGPTQSAFIEGRNILDNVIVAHELVKGYSHKGVSPRCMVKVDIRKAYDSVNWGFLKMLLLEYGIPLKVVELIMTHVFTVSYSLFINGGLTPIFQAKKGLRKGDPMSPYLFVLAMEYLNMSLKQLRHNLDFNYHSRCASKELVHICFVDDLLMCCRADKVSIQLMLQAFHHFSTVSGLRANLEKSSFYVASVSPEFKIQIIQDMHFSIGEMPFKYLGVPLSSRKLSMAQCLPLVEKIIDRIKCWTTKFLSYSGRVQLIKSVLFEMQTYWAQVFLLPKKILTMVVRKLFGARDWLTNVGNNMVAIEEFEDKGKFSIKKAYQFFIPQLQKENRDKSKVGRRKLLGQPRKSAVRDQEQVLLDSCLQQWFIMNGQKEMREGSDNKKG
ncbi:uncharacterized protein LOC142177098 [Nicotiana tabacum]|uniref:Uncharacterized protein LOC142177098 n=1 Tax=Nicotiana tabacum TaxID=4097 RepID=A0AC58TWT6_TOBAC